MSAGEYGSEIKEKIKGMFKNGLSFFLTKGLLIGGLIIIIIILAVAAVMAITDTTIEIEADSWRRRYGNGISHRNIMGAVYELCFIKRRRNQ